MTDHAELIERLRRVADCDAPAWAYDEIGDAADALAALVAERREISMALGNQPDEPITTAELIEQIERISRIAGKGVLEIGWLKAERDALAAEVARMREALKPFADASDGLEPNDYDARVVAWIGNAEPNGGGAYGLHASDFRRARAALAQEPA